VESGAATPALDAGTELLAAGTEPMEDVVSPAGAGIGPGFLAPTVAGGRERIPAARRARLGAVPRWEVGVVASPGVAWWQRDPTPASTATPSAHGPTAQAAAEKSIRPAPRWRAPRETPLGHATAPLGASATAASAGGSSGGGLPFFLALPFVVALLDLARRVAFDRAASPSEHRDRIPETPG